MHEAFGSDDAAREDGDGGFGGAVGGADGGKDDGQGATHGAEEGLGIYQTRPLRAGLWLLTLYIGLQAKCEQSESLIKRVQGTEAYHRSRLAITAESIMKTIR